jgi:opacity protein-like surface antigen
MSDRWSRTTIAGVLSLSLCAAMASAQTRTQRQPPAPTDAPHWNVEVATGAAPTAGAVRNRLTTGWDLNLGAGYEFSRMLELEGGFMYNGLGVSDSVLQQLQVPNGNARLWSLSIGPRVNFPIVSRLNGFVAGGIGYYRRTVEFTQPTVAVIDIIDPWWGYLGSEIVPANQVLGSVSDNAFGGNIGGGVAMPIGRSGTQVFAEVRYHRAATSPTSTAVVPVSFGVRFSGSR